MAGLFLKNREEFSDFLNFIRRYLLAIMLMNLVWETMQMPLYKIWYEGTISQIIFADLHCTVGDILIAFISLILAKIIISINAKSSQSYIGLIGLTTLFGLIYTAFSEWLNLYKLNRWAYDGLMPVLSILNVEIGLAPLLQWVIIPPFAAWWVSRLKFQ